MNPDRSRAQLLAHAEIFAKGVLAGEINASAVQGLLGSLALQWCIPEYRFSQLEEAIGFCEGFIDGAQDGEH